MGRSGMPPSHLVSSHQAAYPCSGEINYQLTDAPAAIRRVEEYFSKLSPEVDKIDGLSMAFSDWRLNLRSSNTEPLLRLNVETRGDADLLTARLKEVEQVIGAAQG